jgi:hypothetical protein
MANRPLFVVTGLAASSLLLGGAMAGCSSNSSSTASSSSSASSSKQATATSATAGDACHTNPGGQPGVSGGFTNAAGNRIIGDTIMILPDASAAATALDGAKSSLSSNVTGAPQPASVGSNGMIVS